MRGDAWPTPSEMSSEGVEPYLNRSGSTFHNDVVGGKTANENEQLVAEAAARVIRTWAPVLRAVALRLEQGR